MSTEKRPNEQRSTARKTTGDRPRTTTPTRRSATKATPAAAKTSKTTKTTKAKAGATSPSRATSSRTKSPARTGEKTASSTTRTTTRRSSGSARGEGRATSPEAHTRTKQGSQRTTSSRTRTNTLQQAHQASASTSAHQRREQPSARTTTSRVASGSHASVGQRSRTRRPQDTQQRVNSRTHSTGNTHSRTHSGSRANTRTKTSQVSVESKRANEVSTGKFRINPLYIGIAAVLVVIFVACAGILGDPKIYKGVSVGSLDLSGMTKQEAATAISEYYTPYIEQAHVTIYAGDEGREKVQSGEVVDIGPEEQLSVEDVQANTSYWKVIGTDVGAYVNANALAEKAFQVGREDGGLLSRIGSFFFGTVVPAECTFDDSSIENLANKIDATMGYSRVDWNITVAWGHASVVEGSDGLMVNRNTLRSNLSNAFVSESSHESSFTAYVENTPVRIDEAAAQKAADTVNEAIADGASLTYEGQTWTCDAVEIGDWVSGTVASENGAWVLHLGLRQDSFSSDFFSSVLVHGSSDGLAVTFEVKGDDITVHTNCAGSMPQLEPARVDLEHALFDNGGKKQTGQPAKVTVGSGPVPESLSFDEALASGIIAEVSTYTTEYTTGDGTEARNTNIRIGADYINNSICRANGGDWSFNGLVGDTTPDKGYQAAGSIAMGEYVDTYGGGICQVATTVFNALFESPYKIVKRYNHSLYIASYPTGRDAAISWDMLDLTWCNESKSDVLMKTSCGTDSITVSLYSVPVRFTVTSEVGEWEEGEKYEITVKYDENLTKGYSYVKQSGTDGSKITVVRTVLDDKGNVKYSNTFASNYLPKEEIIVAGPGTEIDTKRTDV